MRDKKKLSAYYMTYRTFIYLVRKLEPFVKFKVTMFDRAPLELRKAIRLVLCRYAHGVNANIIVNRFNVKAYTMCKYVDIVIDVLIFRDKLFIRYIFISHSPCLLRIMDEFFHACGLFNVCSTIDESHISLFEKPNKWVIAIPTNYYWKYRCITFEFLLY